MKNQKNIAISALALTLSLGSVSFVYAGISPSEWYKIEIERNKNFTEKGFSQGNYALGKMYESGRGVEKDYIKAVELYQKAAAREHPGAQARLPGMYLAGRGVSRDVSKTREWFKKSCENDYKHGCKMYNIINYRRQ
jgi:TPR repeat protein